MLVNVAKRIFSTLAVFVACSSILQAQEERSKGFKRPNIVWIIVDDMSANFGCYGETAIKTPNVDQLANEGTRFANAFVTAPVCSPCRSALITGMYQTTIGAHHHRSGRGTLKIKLQEGVEPVPAIFKREGYYTCIGGSFSDKKAAMGKTDYNFEWDRSIYDGHDWSGRKPGQPFFMQVQLHGGKNREAKNWKDRVHQQFGNITATDVVRLPPYYPNDSVLLDDWAAYLDACRQTDKEVGDVITRLRSEGILDETLVIFMTDHGISHARGKQFLYNEGTHVPLVVRGPGVGRGHVRKDLVEHIDLAAISLAAAGIPIPKSMQGRNVFASDYKPRVAVFAARDRCDETTERIRSVRTERWLYIRNFHPNRPHLQPNAYKDGKPIVQRLRELHASGQLNQLQEKLLFSDQRPVEELYEWTTDHYQISNLAGNPEHQKTLEDMRHLLERWQEESNDRGRLPEGAMYDSDMDVYLDEMKKSAARRTIIEKNIAQMKTWEKEGK